MSSEQGTGNRVQCSAPLKEELTERFKLNPVPYKRSEHMTDFKEAVKYIGQTVRVTNERYFHGCISATLTACILRRTDRGLYCQAEVIDSSGAVYIVNLHDISEQ